MKSSVLVAVLLTVLSLPVVTSGQEQERVVAWPPQPGKFVGPMASGPDGTMVATESVAVEIVEVLVGGQPVGIGRPFTAGEDWLRGLSIRVKNISDKPLVGARIDFSLPEGKVMSSLEYGRGATFGKGAREQKAVIPGEEFVLIRTVGAYESDRKWMAEKSGRTDFTRVQLGLAWVKFEDGMLWVGQPRTRGKRGEQ